MRGSTRIMMVLAVAGAMAAGAQGGPSSAAAPGPLQTAEKTAQQTALRDTADAQELLSEASQLSPDEAGAAAFARLRAQQLQQAAAAATGQAQELKAKLNTTDTATAMPTAGPAGAAADPLNWGAWDQIASCSGVDLHFALATARDGGEQMRMELVNHNAFPATVTFRPVVLGSEGERQPSAGDYSVTLNPNSTFPEMGDLIPFAIAQYGEADMSVKLQGQPGAASATVPCASKTKSVRN